MGILSKPVVQILAALLFLSALAVTLSTSADSWVPKMRAPSAVQVEAARNAFRAVRASRQTGQPVDVRFSAGDLTSIAALVTQGFPPNRLALEVSRGRFVATVSRPLLFRWINVRAEATGRSDGFPHIRLTIGRLRLSEWMSRRVLAAGRMLLTLRGATIPPLDVLIQSSVVESGALRASVMLPSTGLINQAIGSHRAELASADVARVYCVLTAQQHSEPTGLFVIHLRRALAASGSAPEQHGAALVALAMLVVDPDAGELVGNVGEQAGKCLVPPLRTTLQGRSDWPKHWALSAALSATTGHHFAEAIGEWKELADSLSRQQYLAAGDRSGFSLADLAADRSGNLAARQLLDPATSTQAHSRLIAATDDQLLPRAATRLGDGMSNEEFVSRYGATDDPRFAALLRKIDAALK